MAEEHESESRAELKERIRQQTPSKPKVKAPTPDPSAFQGSVLAKLKKPDESGASTMPKPMDGETALTPAYRERVRKWREEQGPSTQRKAMDNVAKNPPR